MNVRGADVHERYGKQFLRRVPGWRWWADFATVAGLGLVGGLTALLAGDVAVSVTAFSLVIVCGAYAVRCRTEYRRGWRHGYESAVRVAQQFQSGRTPDVEVRAAVHGDPVPEPWDTHVSPLRPRSTA